MYPHKTTRLIVLTTAFILISVNRTCGSNAPASQSAPEISPVDQRLLTQIVRRTITARLAEEAPYKVSYVPPALADITCQIVVTLRENGYARGIGTSDKLPVVQAAQDAAIVALSSARAGDRDDLTSMDRVRIEMQALGPVVDYQNPANWLTPGALLGFIDPGLDGVRLFLDGEGRWFTPGEMISRCLSVEEAVRTLGKEITLDSRVLNEAKLSRFRTTHWSEADADGHVVTLRRGMITVPQADITRGTLDRAITELAEYIRYRQRPDGWFAETFNPAADMYSDDNDALAQAGACWALAEHLRHTGSARNAESLDRGLHVQQSWVTDLPNHANTAFVASPDQRNRLDITAAYCLALAAHPQPEAHAALRHRLVRGMLWLQREDGHFVTVFPPTTRLEAQDRAPGAALLALVASYELDPSAEISDALALAFPYYRDCFARTGSLALAAWHAQAYGRMARLTRRSDYADFTFRLCDRIAAQQLRPDNTADAQLWGAIAGKDVTPGSATAAFTEALATGAELARARGETERFDRYREACRRAARFILQLRFKPEECHYVRSPRDAVGGIRSTAINTRLHLDSCQHALRALMMCRELLFPDHP